MKFSGVIPILATPFTEDESVDLASLAKADLTQLLDVNSAAGDNK